MDKEVFLAHTLAHHMHGEQRKALCLSLGQNEMLQWCNFGQSLIIWSDDPRELAPFATTFGLVFGNAAEEPKLYAMAVYAGLI